MPARWVHRRKYQSDTAIAETITVVEEPNEISRYCCTGTLTSIQIASAPFQQKTNAQSSETRRKKARSRWWAVTSAGIAQNSSPSRAASGRPKATVPRNSAPMAKLPKLGCRK